MTVRENFGRALTEAMSGVIGARELADKMGVSKSMVYRWMHGKSLPDIDRIPDLEHHVQAPPGSLRRVYVGDEPDVSHLDVSDLSPAQRRRLADFLAGLRAGEED